jgi:protein-tyrosine phosphatase
MLREVIPNLWVASMPKPEMVAECGADAIICTVSKGSPKEVQSMVHRYSEYPIPDGKYFKADLFERALEDLQDWMDEGRTVMVHCHAGRNRSATLIALYMMQNGWSAKGAIYRIRDVRPRAIANPVFEAALLAGGLK